MVGDSDTGSMPGTRVMKPQGGGIAASEYPKLLERVPAIIYVADIGGEGLWHYVSAQIEQILGYSAEEWCANPALWAERLHPEDRDWVLARENGMQRRQAGRRGGRVPDGPSRRTYGLDPRRRRARSRRGRRASLARHAARHHRPQGGRGRARATGGAAGGGCAARRARAGGSEHDRSDERGGERGRPNARAPRSRLCGSTSPTRTAWFFAAGSGGRTPSSVSCATRPARDRRRDTRCSAGRRWWSRTGMPSGVSSSRASGAGGPARGCRSRSREGRAGRLASSWSSRCARGDLPPATSTSSSRWPTCWPTRSSDRRSRTRSANGPSTTR